MTLPRTPLLLLVALLLGTPGPRAARADDAAKDAEIAALKAELATCRATLEQKETALQKALTAIEVLRREVAALKADGAQPAGPVEPIPGADELAKNQETSREQMRYLHYCFRTFKPAAGQPQWPALDGKSFVLWLVAVGQLEKTNEATLKMLFSPADKANSFPGLASYASLTPDLLAKQRFPSLTSYVGRRNSVASLAINTQSPPATTALFADLSLGTGALVCFLDGKVKYMRRSDLGLGPTDPLVAGPASKSPLLQTLSAE